MKLEKGKNLGKFLLVFSFLFIFSACSIQTNSSGLQSGSSVFVSGDNGNTWRDASRIKTAATSPEVISNTDVLSFYGDPGDSAAIYLASANGLYKTYNLSQGWDKVSSLSNESIRSVAVSRNNKCLIYVAIGNRLYRSDDCSRNFAQIYYDNDKTVSVNSIVIDHYNPQNLYLGTSRGELIKSIDGGNSWRTIYRFQDSIAKVLISPQDSRLIFVATNKSMIYSLVSNTETNPATSSDVDANFQVSNFKDLNAVLLDLGLSTGFKDLVAVLSDGSLYLATNKMILRSRDNGITWKSLNLIQPDGQAAVNTIAVNPRDSKEIYYLTDTTFFRSLDDGITWTSKKLPSARGGSALWVDFNYTKNVYLGTYRVSNK
ncbi:MAG: hypothetical protein PHE99_06330 [Bacteroidales bacterium]|nr:hypothetical protein [Bacteroidales bacterium]